MSKKVYKVGTRGSKLALAQTGQVVEYLKKLHSNVDFKILTITTEGDHDTATSLEQMGGVGVFTKKIEQELLEHNIDIAVHSAKDLPSVMTEGLAIGAVPERESCSDVWISHDGSSIHEIKAGAVVGTGSPRRRAQLLCMRPELTVTDIRGNVDTRLKKVKEGKYDAILMAHAGLKRAGLDKHITQVLPPDRFIPAPGQGFLLIQIRNDDNEALEITRAVNHEASRRCLTIERLLLEKLQAGCSAAVGGWARFSGNKILLSAVVLDKDGKTRLYAEGNIDYEKPNEKLAKSVTDKLLAKGAAGIIKQYES
ncbi:MAG: hydroxymethylbilane synthase [candidate division Zixibacteria bacterium HGW-Zixibacteria-1]|nr:MAG: hydroxymethylbilane synthase [candidate division Zixibacteria bacterium HGW-Zixibacteria-1]